MRGIILCLLSLIAAPALGEEHAHVWGETTCEVQECIGRCCTKKCIKFCTVCLMPRVWSETKCSGQNGASGEYSTAPLMSLDLEPMSTPWGPRPGGAAPAPSGCGDGADHDWSDEQCGPWSHPYESKPDCEVRVCDRQCQRCHTNGKTRIEKRGQCRAPAHDDHEHDVAQVSIWGPRPGAGGPSTQECPPHDLGPANCGGWHEISPGCKIQHCTRQCRKCGSNRGDYYNSQPAGCFDD